MDHTRTSAPRRNKLSSSFEACLLDVWWHLVIYPILLYTQYRELRPEAMSYMSDPGRQERHTIWPPPVEDPSRHTFDLTPSPLHAFGAATNTVVLAVDLISPALYHVWTDLWVLYIGEDCSVPASPRLSRNLSGTHISQP